MNDILKTAVPSVVRTVVPILYALLVRVGFTAWIGNDPVLNNFLTLVVTGLIYTAIRFLEAHRAAFGWLLGYASQPVYGEVPPNPPREPYASPDEAGFASLELIGVVLAVIGLLVLLLSTANIIGIVVLVVGLVLLASGLFSGRGTHL